jgi:hypothetical protein
LPGSGSVALTSCLVFCPVLDLRSIADGGERVMSGGAGDASAMVDGFVA